MTAWRKVGNVREVSISTVAVNGVTTPGSTPTTFVALSVVPVVVCSTELVGVSGPDPSAEPMSQYLIGSPAGASGAPMPLTYTPFQLPARLFQKMLLNIFGLLNVGAPPGRVAWSCRLLPAVDSPAGAGLPSLVAAVAVVMLPMTVLLTIRTSTESSRAMPPPSCVDTLSTIMLFVTLIGKLPACSMRVPPPSSLAGLASMVLLAIVTGPEPVKR